MDLILPGKKNKAGIYYSGSDGNITGNKLVYNKYGILLKKNPVISQLKITLSFRIIMEFIWRILIITD